MCVWAMSMLPVLTISLNVYYVCVCDAVDDVMYTSVCSERCLTSSRRQQLATARRKSVYLGGWHASPRPRLGQHAPPAAPRHQQVRTKSQHSCAVLLMFCHLRMRFATARPVNYGNWCHARVSRAGHDISMTSSPYLA